MKSKILNLLFALLTAGSLSAAIITVTTTNNVSPAAGETSLLQALSNVHDGDEIRFNIPGNGPHYIATPPTGYPYITANDVSIDGYSQPGSSPNSNPILAPNNSKITIVLDSRAGGHKLMDFPGTAPNDDTGYGDKEAAILGVLGAQNFDVEGVCFLGTPLVGPDSDIALYFVSFARGASGGEVDGCWMGVDLDGKSLHGAAACITGFRYRGRDEANTVTNTILINDTVIGVKKGAANAVADFNVIVHAGIPIIIEGNNTRISGNFLTVLPDGLHDDDVAFDPILTGNFEGAIEIGRGGNNTLIGTDGDGINDANERNIFGGTVPPSMGGYDHTIEFYGQNPGTNIIIAGNYIGVGIDGHTLFTNGVPALNAPSAAEYRFGSDFDGVSDALEANVVYNNWPVSLFKPEEFATVDKLSFFDELSTGGLVSARGNTFVNNFPFPASPAKNGGQFLIDYYAKALADSSAGVFPTLSSNSSTTKLVGTVPLPNTTFSNVIIDLYLADPIGITNGLAANMPELTNGFVQGMTYLGSFVEGSANDLNPAPGAFEFSLAGVDLKGAGPLTITANYSVSPAGTHNAKTLTSPFSDPVTVSFIPGGVASVGLKHIVPDVILWYNSAGNYATSGPVIPSAQVPYQSSWEPYISVMGNSTFLIEANSYADDGTAENMRMGLVFQPVAGGAPKLGNAFYDDSGKAWTNQINLSRQTGNPGRVAGDKRAGATTFIAGGEVSLYNYAAFNSDGRFNPSLPFYTTLAAQGTGGRDGSVQTFSLDAATLAQTMLAKAMDSAFGRCCANSTPADTDQVSRFGGELAGLDDGNFVSVVEDRSRLFNSAGNAAVATIFRPDGSIVKEAFLVANGDLWSNVAAFRGGFCVRVAAVLYFFDNAGNLQGSSNQSTGITTDTGRGDGTRIGADIRSPYVYLAGKEPESAHGVVTLAIWDSRTRNFVASAPVSETDPAIHTVDRVTVAVDALDRVCVAYVLRPNADFTKDQIAARVMKFDGTNVTYLTHNFFPFVNYDSDGTHDLTTANPSVAMTTEYIAIAGKGAINSTNNPAGGPDTAANTTLYTVINNPGAATAATIKITSIVAGANNVTINWTGGTGPYLVQQKGQLRDPAWQTVQTTPNQTATIPMAGQTGFFRISQQ